MKTAALRIWEKSSDEKGRIKIMAINHKNKLRKEILSLRNQMNLFEKERADFLITERVLGHNWFQTSDNILCYVNTGSEVSTRMILEESIRLGKNVYVPKVYGDKMKFLQINSLKDLEQGFKGILEPIEGLPLFSYSYMPENSLMIMPGVVFDKNRNRIGYGKGYYDKYLSDKPLLKKMALAYSCQIVDSFQVEEHDCKPDVIISHIQNDGGFQ